MPWTVEEFNWVRFTVKGRCLGQDLYQRRDFIVGSVVGDPIGSDQILEELMIAWATACLTWLPASYTALTGSLDLITSLLVDPGPPVRVSPQVGLHEETPFAESSVGLIVSEPLPLQVSARGRKITAGADLTDYLLLPNTIPATPVPTPEESRFKGRVQWGPLPTSGMVSGDLNRLNESLRLGIQGALDTLTVVEIGEDPDTIELSEITVSLIHDADVRVNATDDPLVAFQVVNDYDVAQIVGTSDTRTPRA